MPIWVCCNISQPFFLFFKNIYVCTYLFIWKLESQTERKIEWESYLPDGSPTNGLNAMARPGQSQKPGNPSGSPTWEKGAKSLGHPLQSSQVHYHRAGQKWNSQGKNQGSCGMPMSQGHNASPYLTIKIINTFTFGICSWSKVGWYHFPKVTWNSLAPESVFSNTMLHCQSRNPPFCFVY